VTAALLELLFEQFSVGQLVAVCCTIVVATVMQSAVGFGFNLLAVPVLLFFGLKLHEAIAVSVVAQVWQHGVGVWHTRAAIVWRPLVPAIIAVAIFLFVGVALQGALRTWEASSIRRLVGVLILAGLLTMWYFKPTPKAHRHVAWAWLAGACGGLMGGLVGAPGPPLVLWIMAHDWSNQRLRGSIWAMFILLVPVLFVFLWLRYGNDLLIVMLPSVALIPIIQLAAMFGVRIGSAMSKQLLRRIAFALLLIIAVVSMLGL
jgi:uncharacterized membrane protein YfcA